MSFLKGNRVNFLEMQKRKIVFFVILFSFFISFTQIYAEQNIQQTPPNTQEECTTLTCKQQAYTGNLEKLQRIDNTIQQLNSIWLKRFDSFKTYHYITNEITELEKKNLDSTLSAQQMHRLETLRKQQTLLEQYRNKPFGELLDKPTLEAPPTIMNPFGIFTAISYMKHITSIKVDMQTHKQEIDKLITTMEKKIEILDKLANTDSLPINERNNYKEMLTTTQDENLELQSARNILETTYDVFEKDADAIESNLKVQIKNQLFKLGYIGIGILISIVIAFAFKLLVKRYIQHHERAYTTNKVINVINITIIFLILLFAYIDNATYAVAMVGFASAGLAIAMKDMFMSTLGWLVIVVGGSIHVGDRIRVKKDNEVFIGDVLDISMLRITIYDDITLTSYRENHRAGRLIFIPNNYIFTNLISNYTYGDLTNIWDSIEVRITFDSDIEKAKKIALEIATKHAKMYTEQTRQQMQRMRDIFALAHSTLNVDPKVFVMVKENGIDITLWFQNYAYATLKLKSTIGQELVVAYLKEDDIHIAYPITRIVYERTNGLDEYAQMPPNWYAESIPESYFKKT